jgi:hypothetical protein
MRRLHLTANHLIDALALVVIGVLAAMGKLSEASFVGMLTAVVAGRLRPPSAEPSPPTPLELGGALTAAPKDAPTPRPGSRSARIPPGAIMGFVAAMIWLVGTVAAWARTAGGKTA